MSRKVSDGEILFWSNSRSGGSSGRSSGYGFGVKGQFSGSERGSWRKVDGGEEY